MGVPTLDEIVIFDTLDEQAAAEHFLEKSVGEAARLFGENSVYYLEDLMWMGPNAFCYYIRAVSEYLASSESESDAEGLETLQGVFRFRLENERNELTSALPEINKICRYVCEHLAKYCADDSEGEQLRKAYVELAADTERAQQCP